MGLTAYILAITFAILDGVLGANSLREYLYFSVTIEPTLGARIILAHYIALMGLIGAISTYFAIRRWRKD